LPIFNDLPTDIFCVLNNQPERRSNLKLANGNSILHGRFGYKVDARQVQDSIKSCDSCSRSIIMEATTKSVHSEVKMEWRDGTCLKCSAWMYHMQHKNLNYTPNKNFPINKIPEKLKGGKMPPVQKE
jgi:hypothetical protein